MPSLFLSLAAETVSAILHRPHPCPHFLSHTSGFWHWPKGRRNPFCLFCALLAVALPGMTCTVSSEPSASLYLSDLLCPFVLSALPLQGSYRGRLWVSISHGVNAHVGPPWFYPAIVEACYLLMELDPYPSLLCLVCPGFFVWQTISEQVLGM